MTSNFVKITENKKPNEEFTLYRSNYSWLNVVFSNNSEDYIRSELAIPIKNYNETASAIQKLIFSGSKSNPFPLKTISKQFYSKVDGYVTPNITTYQLNSLNEEAYLSFLPCFMNYIFKSDLSQNGYDTEIHHIDGDSGHGGALFNQIKNKYYNRETIPYSDWLDSEKVLLKIPFTSDNDNPFYCRFELVQMSYKSSYKMENCFLTIQGKVGHEKVLKAISEFEKKNFTKIARPTVFNPLYSNNKFKNDIKIIEIPYDDGYTSFELMWKVDAMSVKSYYIISILIDYFCDQLTDIFKKDKIGGYCRPFFGSYYNSSLYGFKFVNIPVDKIDEAYFHKLFYKIQTVLLEKELDLIKIKRKIHENFLKKGDILDTVKIGLLDNLKSRKISVNSFYFTRSLYRQFLRGDTIYWNGQLKEFICKEYTMIIFKPDKELNDKLIKQSALFINQGKDQTELERIQKRLDASIASNKIFFNIKIDFSKLKKIDTGLKSAEYKKDEIKDITLAKNLNDLKIPINYRIDKNLGCDFVKFDLSFDLKDLADDYYPILMLFTKLFEPESTVTTPSTTAASILDYEPKVNKPENLINSVITIKNNHLIYSISTKLKDSKDDTGEIGIYLENLLNFDRINKEKITKTLDGLIRWNIYQEQSKLME